jgi:uncharacterized UBP type Zn finger protein
VLRVEALKRQKFFHNAQGEATAPSGKKFGIVNSGNYCYLIATLQLILSSTHAITALEELVA